MKSLKPVLMLSGLIVGLAFIAAGAGVLTAILWQPDGAHFSFTTLRGESVPIQGGGLYRFDSVSGAAQAIAQDVVTLLLGLPLLITALVLAARGSLRGRVLLSGTLGYFLYTYASLALLAAYNELFLIYVALLSLSLFAFVLSLLALDGTTLAAHISDKFPRRTIAGFTLFLGVMLTVLWLGRIIPALLAGTPPAGLESYTTLVIQVLDLAIIVPIAILTGVLLLRRVLWGTVLAACVLVFGLSMGAALTAMVVGQGLAGVAMSPVELVIFPAVALVNLVLLVLLLRSLSDQPVAARQSSLTPPALAPGEYRPAPQRG